MNSWQLFHYKKILNLVDKSPVNILLEGYLGINDIALELTRYLLCISPIKGFKCNACNSCLLYEQSSNPDIQFLSLDENTNHIKVKQIRTLNDFIYLAPSQAKYKIIVIENTNHLNLNSANALLKILEEPPEYIIFILVTTNMSNILPTIRSRCYKYKITPPKIEVTNSFWAKFYQNYPAPKNILTETELAKLIAVLTIPKVENILNLINIEFGFFIKFLTKWLNDLISLKMYCKITYFEIQQMENLVTKLQLDKAFYLVDRLNYYNSWTEHPLNYKIHIENILFHYQQLFLN